MNAPLDPERYFLQPHLERVHPLTEDTQVLRNRGSELSRIKWAKCIAFLERAKHLPKNWDGDGAVRPRSDAIDSLVYYFETYLLATDNFPGPSRMAVTPDGALFVEWQEAGLYMDLECTTPGRAEFLIMKEDEPPKKEEVRWSVSLLNTTPSAVVAIPFAFGAGGISAAFLSSGLVYAPAA